MFIRELRSRVVKRPPGGTKEECVEFVVVLKEDSQTIGDGKDDVAMGSVFNHFAVAVLREHNRSFGAARRAHPAPLAGEGDKE